MSICVAMPASMARTSTTVDTLPAAQPLEPEHGAMTGVLDPEHRYRLTHLDLVVPGGQPMR
jgi:hypothetical protein